jgi:hypothetical protein
MPNDTNACPHCGVAISKGAMRKNRPFSCPNCRKILALNDPYHNHGTVGFFSFLALSIAVAAFVGNTGSRVTLIVSIVVGVIVGCVVGIAAAIAVIWALTNLFPRAPKLGRYVLCDDPKLLGDTADFLDSICGHREWSWEHDRHLDSLWRYHSQDDDLEEEALVAAEEFKARLTKSSKLAKHVSDEIRKLNLGDLREELAAIASDLRIAAK